MPRLAKSFLACAVFLVAVVVASVWLPMDWRLDAMAAAMAGATGVLGGIAWMLGRLYDDVVRYLGDAVIASRRTPQGPQGLRIVRAR